MKIIQLIKPGLFIYECTRMMILVVVIVFQKNDPSLFTKIIFSTPGALFPLMALFIWLDTERYKAYLYLFAAGKCIGIFALLGWSIISMQVTMIGSFLGIAVIAELLLFCGDLFAIAAVLLIIKDAKNLTETPAITEAAGVPEMEDK